MKFTTGCLEDNQLKHLLVERDIWSLDFVVVLEFVVLKWQDLNSLSSNSQCAFNFKHLFGGFTVYELSPCQLFIWVHSKEGNFCQTALQVRKHSIQSKHSVFFTIICTDCYRACLCHQRPPVWHLFILPFQLKSKGTLGFYGDKRFNEITVCAENSKSTEQLKLFTLFLFIGRTSDLFAYLIGRKEYGKSSQLHLPCSTYPGL